MWDEIHKTFDLWSPPLRPSPEVVAKFSELTYGAQSAILLGCTKELAHIVPNTITIDKNAVAISSWHGNAFYTDWFNLTFHADVVIGDGSLVCVDKHRWVELIELCLQKSKKVVLRVYEAPTNGVYRGGRTEGHWANFHCLKWALAMLMAQQRSGMVRVAEVYSEFHKAFDKEELLRVTGWRREVVDTLELYKNSEDVYTFLTEAQIKSVFPSCQRVEQLGYPFAEHCPFYIFQ